MVQPMRDTTLTERSALAQAAQERWDLVIIGGGITGAGIFREAGARGLKALLVEQGDFASGTSSRSSKLVHGGLRYLGHGQWRLTRDSVREREALLRAAPGLVEPQPFVFPVFRDQSPGLGVTRLGLALYDLIAGKRRSRRLAWSELERWAPGLSTRDLAGVLGFEDASTDDARLVLRQLQEGCAAGGQAYNYLRAAALLEDEGRIVGVELEDRRSKTGLQVLARYVINATGAWADRWAAGEAPRLRPLRGSHLLFDRRRLPLPAAVSFLHPLDRRPVFAYEWEGASLLGTTDLDHTENLDREPRITAGEVDYLLAAAAHAWPGARLAASDVVASYAGVRPVIDSGAEKPSAESRESALWQAPGYLGVTGGKLTTFRLTAREVLATLDDQAGAREPAGPIFDRTRPRPCPPQVDPAVWRRLYGRYGQRADTLLNEAQAGELSPVGRSRTLWAELRYAARHEAIVHLDDLLLRRTSLGLVLPDAVRGEMPAIRELCQPLLDWSDRRWGNEEGAWYRRWDEHYHLPAEWRG